MYWFYNYWIIHVSYHQNYWTTKVVGSGLGILSLCDVILRFYDIMTYHLISYYYIMLCHVMFIVYFCISYYLVLHYVVSCYIISYFVILIMFYRIVYCTTHAAYIQHTVEEILSLRWGLIKDGSMARAGAPGGPPEVSEPARQSIPRNLLGFQ